MDAHNLKALLKARAAAMEAGPLLLQGGKYPVEMLEACVKADNFYALGGALARELKDVETIREPRLLSAAVDRAVYAEILETVRRRHAPLLREYFETQAACLNRLAALRGKRLGWDAKTLAPMLLPLPPVKEDDPSPSGRAGGGRLAGAGRAENQPGADRHPPAGKVRRVRRRPPDLVSAGEAERSFLSPHPLRPETGRPEPPGGRTAV